MLLNVSLRNAERRRMVIWEKCTLCLSTYVDQPYPVRPHYPHMGRGLAKYLACFSMGYLIDGGDSVMHEGMVRWPTPDLGPSTDRRIGVYSYIRRAKLWVLPLRASTGDRTEWWRNVHREGSYTSMSKPKARAGYSTSHTPGMAGRGWHDEFPGWCG